MSAGEIRADYRIAVYGGDSTALLALLSDGAWLLDALQLIGDGLLDALRNKVPAAETPARRCVAGLRARGWEGDDVLADALEARLGTGPVPLLRPLAVDMDLLTMGLEGDEVTTGGRIDLATGEFYPEIDGGLDDSLDDEEDEREWLWVEALGSRAGYRDMEAFIARLDNGRIADQLDRAIQGRGAFRRFKDTLARTPDLLEAWFSFSEDRQLGRARAWLADQGYTPTRQ